MGAIASAQNDYQKTHHYDLFSNCEIGLTAQYTRNFTTGPGNVGANLHLYKQIGSHSRFRVLGGIDGFLANGFDRKVFAMVGVSADFLPFYMFLDGGVTVNPSSVQTVNPAADAGIGLNFNIGRNLRMFAEAGADITLNGANQVNPNGFVRFGYAYHTGITENDRREIETEQSNTELVNELTRENRELRTDNLSKEEANRAIQLALDRATAACEAIEKRLKDCTEQPAAAPSTLTVYFDYASAELNETDMGNLRRFAESIADGNGYYRIDGYASPDGSPENNQRISQERADAVFKYLKSCGIASSRMAAIGNGVGSEYDGQATLNRIARISKITQ